MDYSKTIFNNTVSDSDQRAAEKSKKDFIRKFTDDSEKNYNLKLVHNNVLDDLGTLNMVITDEETNLDVENPLIIGNIRMGFGHYRISMAMASCARALGYTPIWMDLNSFKETTGAKIINHQNDLYSFGSRLSSKSKVFNRVYWEPLNYEGFRQLKQNSGDQKVTELATPVFRNIDPEIPFVATHVWPSQAAIHAGFKNVVNAIPDNWQMALHLSEGAIHTVQTPYAYFGYKTLRGMDKKNILKPMYKDSIKEVGHYIDHELVVNLDADCDKRIERAENNKPLRYLITVGGAGSQAELFREIIKDLLRKQAENKAAIFINVGDHKNVMDELIKDIPQLKDAVMHINDYEGAKAFAEDAYDNDVNKVHMFYDEDIFAAVYTTNLLMRCSDVLVTKPSELAFYPIPKLFIHRIGGHEKWGAIHSAEIGDGTYECETIAETLSMIDLFTKEPEHISMMCNYIKRNNSIGMYNGAYKAVELAAKNNK